jgi:hypothetical protein
MDGWYGWAWYWRRWHRLTGPHEKIGAAHRALEQALRERGWSVQAHEAVLTNGPQVPRRLDLTRPCNDSGHVTEKA